MNPQTKAVIATMYDLARQAVQKTLPDGPFTGVPFLRKDALDEFAGVPLTMGSKACRNSVPKQDSEMVRLFKKAGLVILGKTNVPEFGLSGVTEPEAFGPTRNPWNLDHSPGGSSGGSAAAVASGMVPMASGNDGGGSIRIPASCCGLFDLKPSRGRTPLEPEMQEIWQGAVVCHVLTRTVRDSAAMMDACQGPAAGSTNLLPPPERPYLKEIERDPGPLRIAFSMASPIGTEVQPECVRAVGETASLSCPYPCTGHLMGYRVGCTSRLGLGMKGPYSGWRLRWYAVTMKFLMLLQFHTNLGCLFGLLIYL
jgi:amidase